MEILIKNIGVRKLLMNSLNISFIDVTLFTYFGATFARRSYIDYLFRITKNNSNPCLIPFAASI